MAQVIDIDRTNLVVNGEAASFELPFMRRGMITWLYVRQTGGTSVAFTVDVFSRQQASEASLGSESVGDAEHQGTAEMYRVLPQFSTSAPGEFIQEDFGSGRAYLNKDDRDETRAPKLDKRKIHVRITPDSPGAYEFEMCIRGLDEIL